MHKTDRLFALVGMAVGAALTWYAYYSNSHPQAPKLGDFVYLVLFPPSIGLMATENANKFVEAIVIAAVVAANGGWFAFLSAAGRKIFSSRPKATL
jgi:hypothetical protein